MFKFKGFTIIETLTAISVILIGIVGIYSIVPHSLLWEQINIDRFIALQLAREGLELVRNLRDTNWIQKKTWNEGLTNEGLTYCSSPTLCEIDYDDSNLSSSTDRFLKINTKGFYQYEDGKETKFKRKIEITKCKTDTECLKIKTIVKWTDKEISLEEHLYNWKITF